LVVHEELLLKLVTPAVFLCLTVAIGPGCADAPASKGVPDKALAVLKYVDKYGEAIEGYEGGRSFGNFEKNLPQKDEKGKKINYREWDVNPLKKGVNRGPERLVTGSDGSAYYTGDHYKSFVKVRGPSSKEERP
jgi:guanyl-specific ribonuclease Sa